MIKKIIVLTLLLTSLLKSQSVIDSTMKATNVYTPTMQKYESAYYDQWAKSVKADTIKLRPGNYFSIQCDTVNFSFRLDSTKGAGNNRTSFYTATWIGPKSTRRVQTYLGYNSVYNTQYYLSGDMAKSWPKDNAALRYNFQAGDSIFSKLAIDTLLTDTSIVLYNLNVNKTYAFRVRSAYSRSFSAWTSLGQITMGSALDIWLPKYSMMVEPIKMLGDQQTGNLQVVLRISYYIRPILLYN